jgi:hypothetical protein
MLKIDVYGRYNELVNGVYKPTSSVRGHHPVGLSPGFHGDRFHGMILYPLKNHLWFTVKHHFPLWTIYHYISHSSPHRNFPFTSIYSVPIWSIEFAVAGSINEILLQENSTAVFKGLVFSFHQVSLPVSGQPGLQKNHLQIWGTSTTTENRSVYKIAR